MPHDLPILKDILVVLLASIPIAFVFHRVRLPMIAGFMATGVLIGPYGLGLIQEIAAIEALAEIGVVLLLFAIGLEFSLRRIIEMKRLVLIGGGLQVGLTIALIALLEYALGRPTNQAVFLGFLISLSSTAIVLKAYIDRAEIDTPHGRVSVGILLFQDLCIVPMMLLVPMLSGKEGLSAVRIAITLGTAAAAVTVIVVAARIVVPFLLQHIVRLRSPEVFVIFIVVVGLGTSWLTAHFGLSLALGAFIAGLVLSESEYSHQIVADVLPFRDVFNSIFFVSIGMLLSLGALASNIVPVVVLLAGLIAVKMLVVVGAVLVLGYSLRIATVAAVGLAQIGEFSFILAKVGSAQGMLSDRDYQIFLATSILSMVATPFLIKAAPRIGYALQSFLSPGSMAEPSLADVGSRLDTMRRHVVIVGYGLNGRDLARVLKSARIPYCIVELNPETVRTAAAEGEKIIYGDSTRAEVLHKLHIEHARVVVLAISDPIATRRTLRAARAANAAARIIVRTRYMVEIEDLFALGANQVIPEEFETSIEIFSRVLREYGVARSEIQHQVETIRQSGYAMLRAPSLERVELERLAEALASASTETVLVATDAPAVGRTIGELRLRAATGATVLAVNRQGANDVNPGPNYRLEAGDAVVLFGSPNQIDLAVDVLTDPDVAPHADPVET